MQPKLDLHYTDPRLVELYDLGNPAGADTAFYVQLASDIAARTIIDLGCGTGRLTRALATGDRVVRGVDPSAAMLAVAQRNDAEQRITWIEGTSAALGTFGADLVLMTGNVAQVFLDDSAWGATLVDIRRTLAAGGRLAFESRNPHARAWETWNREATHTITDTPFGPVEEWLELVAVNPRTVTFTGHNLFRETGESLVVESGLRFRSVGELTTSLQAAGFTIEQLYGDWDRSPFVEASRMMIVVAQR